MGHRETSPAGAAANAVRRVGHKGADAIIPGNTIESFEAAVEEGVDMIELDVLRDREGRLIIAHDHEDARRRKPLDLADALDAFLEPPLDQVEIDLDLKLRGREAELAGAIAGSGLVERAMVSTMEVDSLIKLHRVEPDLRLGWTFPKTRRDWTSYGWARAGVAAGLALLRARFPRLLIKRAPELGIHAVWAYHQVITPRLVAAAEQVDVEVIAWTVDDLDRMRHLREMGVHGICTNDPRLFAAIHGENDEGPGPDADGVLPRAPEAAEDEEAGADAPAEGPDAPAEGPDAKAAPADEEGDLATEEPEPAEDASRG